MGPMSSSDDLAKIKARLRALREKTTTNGCTQEEAIAAASKAAELLSQYGLSEDDLSADLFVFARRFVGKRSPLEDIWFAGATFADCKAYYQKDGSRLCLVFFGRERDVLVAEYVFDVLKSASDRASREFRVSDTYRKRRTPKTRAQAMKIFQEGLSRSLVAKIIDGLWERYGENSAERYQRTQDLLDRQLGSRGFRVARKVRKLGKASGAFREEAYGQGLIAGREIDVNAGVAEAPREVVGFLR